MTVIRGRPLEDAQAWFSTCRASAAADGEVAEALRVLNRAIHAHRVAAGDPYVLDLKREHARRIRIGYGSGDDLVEGRWREAYDLPQEAERRSRRRMLAPDEQLALILSGRREIHPSEELLLRARLDLDQARGREAALQARAAQTALEAEEAGGGLDVNASLERLQAVALERALTGDELAELDELVTKMERFARRRRHAAG